MGKLNKLLLGLVGILVVVFIFSLNGRSYGQSELAYTSPTQASTTVGIYSAVQVLAGDSSRSYAYICNNSIVANDAVYLGFSASSTRTSGVRVPSGGCYEMTLDKMFRGQITAIASTATTTLLYLYK